MAQMPTKSKTTKAASGRMRVTASVKIGARRQISVTLSRAAASVVKCRWIEGESPGETISRLIERLATIEDFLSWSMNRGEKPPGD
jgi:hypothetical protein